MLNSLSLTQRKKDILKSLVDEYIFSGEPVSSRRLARKYMLNCSPATIRNELAELEEEELIQKSHLYSGRIPADTGYRYYVDNLLELKNLTSEEKNKITQLNDFSRVYKQKENLVKNLFKYSLFVLNSLSKQAAFVFEYRDSLLSLKNFKLIKVSDFIYTIIYQFESNIIENKIWFTQNNLSVQNVEKINNYINEMIKKYKSSFFENFNKEIQKEPAMNNVIEYVYSICELILNSQKSSNIDNILFIEGIKNLLNKKEFANMDKVKQIIDLFENTEILHREIKELIGRGNISVKIGEEFNNAFFNDFSFISINYKKTDDKKGIIGILGPKRMQYERIITILKKTQEKINFILNPVT
ncbi:MAG: heat-inducible transcriptional repressor HrcA [Candidatus Muiribacteriota bacterium]